MLTWKQGKLSLIYSYSITMEISDFSVDILIGKNRC